MKPEPSIIDFPKFPDRRGNLSVIEECGALPFAIERVYWIYDVPGGELRDGHAYRTNRELIVALSGSFDVTVSDGTEKRSFCLNRAYRGVYVPAGLWRELDNFSSNSIALVIASEKYDEADYIRDYDEYLKWKQ